MLGLGGAGDRSAAVGPISAASDWGAGTSNISLEGLGSYSGNVGRCSPPAHQSHYRHTAGRRTEGERKSCFGQASGCGSDIL